MRHRARLNLILTLLSTLKHITSDWARVCVEGSSVVSDPRGEAEVFSDYFANIIQVEHRSDTDYTDHPTIKAKSNRRFSSELNYSPVSTSYICNILDHLNPRKAVGVDGISPRLLHLGSPVLAEEVTNLINFCILNRSCAV